MALQGSSILVEVLADQHCKVVKHRLRQRIYMMRRREQPFAVVCGAGSSSFAASLGGHAHQCSLVRSQSAVYSSTCRITPVGTGSGSQSFVQSTMLRYHGGQSSYI